MVMKITPVIRAITLPSMPLDSLRAAE